MVGVRLYYFIHRNQKSNIPKPETQRLLSKVLIGTIIFLIESGAAYLTLLLLVTMY